MSSSTSTSATAPPLTPQDTTIHIAILTSGGLAPCLSSTIASLLTGYGKRQNQFTIRLYIAGFAGILKRHSIVFPHPWVGENQVEIDKLHTFGGTPIGSSRTKLSNAPSCVKHGLVKPGSNPIHVASSNLKLDGVDVLFCIGGDDTCLQAAELLDYANANAYTSASRKLVVVGLPKTVDNDIHPISQTLGSYTSAYQSALYFSKIVNESTSNPKVLIIHEVMGRDSGYLTSKSAFLYRTKFLNTMTFPSGIWNEHGFITQDRYDIHAVIIPEVEVDFSRLGHRLRGVMEDIGVVNVFVSEGACSELIQNDTGRDEASGKHEKEKDAFGHVALNEINAGEYIGHKLGALVGAEKVLVQKSGYFARSGAVGVVDRGLIEEFVDFAIESAQAKQSGVIGQSTLNANQTSLIPFELIKGSKPFDHVNAPWFNTMMTEIENYGYTDDGGGEGGGGGGGNAMEVMHGKGKEKLMGSSGGGHPHLWGP